MGHIQMNDLEADIYDHCFCQLQICCRCLSCAGGSTLWVIDNESGRPEALRFVGRIRLILSSFHWTRVVPQHTAIGDDDGLQWNVSCPGLDRLILYLLH